MNPIENAWAILKRNLREQSTHPTTKDALFQRISDVWDSLPNQYFEKLIGSISKRVKALEDARGLSTKY